MPTPSTLRRTSSFTLTVPAPEHTDADLFAALTALVQAAQDTGVEVCDSAYHRHPSGPTLSVSYRVADDDTASALAFQVLAAYGAAEPAQAHMHTGYGIHRRDFPLAG